MSLVETRELRFSPLSLRFALAHAGQAAARLGLPKGVPEAIQFRPDVQDILIRSGGEERSLDAAALGVLLIAYCLRSRIPLPRLATKAVRVHTEAVALVTRLEHEMPPEPAERPSEASAGAPRQMVWGR